MTSAAERSEKLAAARRKLLEYQQKHSHPSPSLQPSSARFSATGSSSLVPSSLSAALALPSSSSSSISLLSSSAAIGNQSDYSKISSPLIRPNSVNSPRSLADQTTIELLMKERQDAMSRLQILQNQMQERDQQLAQLQIALKESNQQLSVHFDQSTQLRQQNDRLLQNERELSGAFGRLQQSHRDLQAKSEQQRLRIDQLENSVTSLAQQSMPASEISQSVEASTNVQQQLTLIENLAAERLATIEKMTGEINHLHQSNLRLQQQAAEGEQREQQLRAEILTQREQFELRIAKVQEESAQQTEDRLMTARQLQQDYDSLTTAYRNLQENFNNRRKSMTDAAASTADVDGDVDADGDTNGQNIGGQGVSPQSSAVAMLQQENQSLYTHLQEMRGQYTATMTALAELQDELSRERQGRNRLQAEIEAFEFYKIELERLRAIIRDQQSQLGDSDDQTRKQLDLAGHLWAEERSRLQDRIDLLQARNEQLTETLREREGALDVKVVSSENIDNNDTKLFNSPSAIDQQSLDRLTEENDELRRMLSDLQSQLETLQNDYNSVSLMNNQLLMEAETIPDYIERYHEERQLIRTKMRQKDVLIKDMVERFNELSATVKRLTDSQLTAGTALDHNASLSPEGSPQQSATITTTSPVITSANLELARSLSTALRASIELTRQAHLVLHPSLLLADSKIEPPPYSPAAVTGGAFTSKRRGDGILQFPPCAQCDPQLIQM